jgi:hypothetical protein
MTFCQVCGMVRKPSELSRITVEREGREPWTGHVCAECKDRLARR